MLISTSIVRLTILFDLQLYMILILMAKRICSLVLGRRIHPSLCGKLGSSVGQRHDLQAELFVLRQKLIDHWRLSRFFSIFSTLGSHAHTNYIIPRFKARNNLCTRFMYVKDNYQATKFNTHLVFDRDFIAFLNQRTQFNRLRILP